MAPNGTDDPLKDGRALIATLGTKFTEWKEERKLTNAVGENLKEAKEMIVTLEKKIEQSAVQINELNKKIEKLKQGIKQKLASSLQTDQSEMNEQIEKDVEEESDSAEEQDWVGETFL